MLTLCCVGACQVQHRQLLRPGVVLGSFKLDIATVMAQQGEAGTLVAHFSFQVTLATIMGEMGIFWGYWLWKQYIGLLVPMEIILSPLIHK